MNIWKTTLLLVLLFTGITVHAQKVKISLNRDGNLTIWKVKAQAEIEHPFDMMTTDMTRGIGSKQLCRERCLVRMY